MYGDDGKVRASLSGVLVAEGEHPSTVLQMP